MSPAEQPERPTYVVVTLRLGRWEIVSQTMHRYSADVAFYDAPQPKRLFCIGRTSGVLLHEQPERISA
jgi:hypothetical protein